MYLTNVSMSVSIVCCVLQGGKNERLDEKSSDGCGKDVG